jgi:hypothetical protein
MPLSPPSLTAPLPAFKDAYSFDPITRECLGVVRVYLAAHEGRYYLPDNVVELAPPTDLGPRQAARLNAQGNAWDVVANVRGVMLWDTTTGRPVRNDLSLGEQPPAGVTAVPPPILSDAEPQRVVWNAKAQAWLQEPDYSRFPVWWKASAQPAPRVPSGQPLPETLTTLSPPAFAAHQAPVWSEEQGTWTLLPDDRGLRDDSADAPPIPDSTTPEG